MELSEKQICNLRQQALNLRRSIVRMIQYGSSGHIGGALSSVEIITTLYFSVLRCDPHNPSSEDRDRFILSAGHKCLALYAVLAEKGYFDRSLLTTHGSLDTSLPGHPDRHRLPGIEANTGSLGHGLSVGGGMALAGKLDRKDYKVYVLMGDGEITEGAVWEATAVASHYHLDKLVAIVDRNGLQIQGKTKEVLNMEPLSHKWESFGWKTREINGHNFVEIFEALSNVPIEKNHPTCIIANTVKGKGLSFAENNYKYHHWKPMPQEIDKAMEELGVKEGNV